MDEDQLILLPKLVEEKIVEYQMKTIVMTLSGEHHLHDVKIIRYMLKKNETITDVLGNYIRNNISEFKLHIKKLVYSFSSENEYNGFNDFVNELCEYLIIFREDAMLERFKEKALKMSNDELTNLVIGGYDYGEYRYCCSILEIGPSNYITIR